MFKKHSYFNNVKEFPKGFIYEKNSYGEGFTMRKYYKQEDRFLEIMNTMKELYDWVRSLPNLKILVKKKFY
jgi:hypothetical protein